LKRSGKGTLLPGAALGVLICAVASLPGCIIVSEIVVLNKTDADLSVSTECDLYPEGYDEPKTSIEPGRHESFTFDLCCGAYLQIWAEDTLITRIPFPGQAIATEVIVKKTDTGGYTIHGKYIGIGSQN